MHLYELYRDQNRVSGTQYTGELMPVHLQKLMVHLFVLAMMDSFCVKVLAAH